MRTRFVLIAIASMSAIPLVACDTTGGQPAATQKVRAAAKVTPAVVDTPVVDGAAPPDTAASSGAWEADESTDQMDDVTNVVLALAADAPLRLPFPYNDDVASLVIRCKKEHTDLYVVTHTPVETAYGDDYEDLGTKIRLRFDDGHPETSYWSESTDHGAVFAPDPIALARRLTHTQHLLVEFTPFESGPTTTSFHTAGLGAVLGKVSRACHWR